MSNELVFTGNKNYVFKKSRELTQRGYVMVRSKLWSDGKYTFVMKRKENG